MQQRFSAAPDPALSGNDYLLCFDFKGLDATYVTVEARHYPAQPDDPQSFIISRGEGDSGCVTRSAPAGTIAIAFTCPQSEDFGLQVQ